MDKLTLERFKEKTRVVGECWVWQGAKINNRYGKMKVYGKTLLAHRLSWEHKHGPIPKDMTVDHKIEEGICTSSLCVRPSHLQLLTNSENSMKYHGSTLTHFGCGHPKHEWNINRDRGCFTCKQSYMAEYYRKRRNALH